MALTDKQRGVARGIGSALLITLAAIGSAVWFGPRILGEGAASRPQLFAASILLPVASLIIAVGALAQHRFHTPADIDGSGLTKGTDRSHVLQAVLQNTLEQTVIAALVYGAWAILAPIPWLLVLPVAAVLFAVGRLAFARGYHRGAPGRALGFGLTFYPSVLMLGLLAGSLAIGRS